MTASYPNTNTTYYTTYNSLNYNINNNLVISGKCKLQHTNPAVPAPEKQRQIPF